MTTATPEAFGTGIPSSKLGMWLFLVSEIMFFTGLLATYIILRAGYPEWPNPADVLNVNLAAFNTFVLLSSSMTIAMGVIAASNRDVKKLRLFLVLTILMGLVFLGVKGIEYSDKFHHGHFPGTGLFYDCYFVLTGVHGLHVFGGVVANLLVLGLTFRQNFFETKGHWVETAGLYWHFVDVVWIFLFPLLYLI